MNREIKFRCWVRDVKDMCYPERLSGIESSFMSEDNDTVIMQFTGLLDKNGKEIYEGDIVRWDKIIMDNYKDIKDLSGKSIVSDKDIVEFKDGKFEFGGYKSKYCEVIGNVYENLELLGEQLDKGDTK